MPVGSVGKFTKPANGAPKAAAPAAPAKKSLSFKGVQSQKPRDESLNEGKYRLRFLSCSITDTDWFIGTFEVVQVLRAVPGSNVVGDVGVLMQSRSGKSRHVAPPILKRWFMAIAGYDNDPEYDAFDPDDEFGDACLGNQNSMSDAAAQVLGIRLVDCDVRRGEERKDENGNLTGDYFRNPAFSPVADDEQDGGPAAA